MNHNLILLFSIIITYLIIKLLKKKFIKNKFFDKSLYNLIKIILIVFFKQIKELDNYIIAYFQKIF